MLKVSPWKGVVRFGKKGKLAPRFVRPFEILERIGLVAYRLRLPEELSSVHDTFHVSNLKKCLADANLHVPLDEIKVDKTLRFVEEPLEIMDHQVGSQYSYCYSIEEDPRTYDEVMQSRDAAFWKEAIDDEIGSVMENNTWVLSDLPLGCKPLGFKQKEGVDYFDPYAPVAHITTIILLLALAVIHNLVIHQMDVKTTFLNGDLDEEVYMKQPEGFVMPGNEHKVCKLVKSLYGLKQAPKHKFDSFGKGVIICLYVDDMLIFGTNQNQVDKTKKFLSSRFSMKDMGEAYVILGIKIKRENKGIVITQSHYIEKLLKKFNREDCSPVSTLMDPVEKLKSNTGKLVDQLEYSKAIGCLIYAMTSTKPDIAYAIGRFSRFTSNPSRQYWHAITRVFKYLQ
ncbi:zinc finger, CCHC-type containing protein, partial [Tanacetum coccineum]